jgi:ribosomal 50S subunit-recycling heat shock protein
MDQVRIDKWLWAARFYKTRSLATDAVLAGHVQVNGARVKPSKDVRVGDDVEVRIGTVAWSLAVTGLSDKRGSATVARTLYAETPESTREPVRSRHFSAGWPARWAPNWVSGRRSRTAAGLTRYAAHSAVPKPLSARTA